MIRSIVLFLLLAFYSCDYLDVVPDNVATLDNAFTMRSMAERYLFTCYSWLPHHADDLSENPALTVGDETWLLAFRNEDYIAWNIARGNQNIVNPFVNFWSGERGGKNMYRGIRECNIFLENIHKVPDMSDYEREQWAAEAKFLKAYYHFLLFRMYGPIPLVRENLSISSSVAEVRAVTRQPVDECIGYMVQLLDEAAGHLPELVQFETQENGRITKPAALALKAYILVTAASPFYNGNADYASFRNSNDEVLFNQTFQADKWEKAALACKEAIDLCHALGFTLYEFQPNPTIPLSRETITEMNVRNPLTQRFNVEQVWVNTNSRAVQIQSSSQPKLLSSTANPRARLGVPMKIAEMFYTDNGVPINEDKDFDYENRFALQTSQPSDSLHLKPNELIPSLHFNREARFYGSLGFDNGRWFGTGWITDADLVYLQAKAGQVGVSGGTLNQSATGYWPKKLVNYLNVHTPTQHTINGYPWPVFRLADLYLLYAEAQNEHQGPGAEVFDYIDRVRKRAGIPPVQQAWADHSMTPEKPDSRDGLREIIRHERLIELVFEGHRFWDLKRWKESIKILNQPIVGWDINQEDALAYYRTRVIFNQQFRMRDYFWPIKESELLINKNLIQSPGW